MMRVYESLGEFKNEFEDFIMASDKKFIAKMNRARQEHKKGKTESWELLKKELYA